MRAVWPLLAVLALLPAAAAQEPVERCARQCTPMATDVNFPPIRDEGPVNVVLYAHVQDILTGFPLNTFPPDPTFEEDVDAGFLMPSFETRLPVEQLNFHFRNNAFRMAHCPGTVERGPEGWLHNCHARYLGNDLVLGGGTIPVYFYISPDPQSPAGDLPIGVAPNIRMHARLVAGQRDGAVLAESGPDGGAMTLISRPGKPDVYELRASMRVHGNHIHESEAPLDSPGFHVEVVLYQHRGPLAEAQQSFRVHSGPRFPPRVIMPVFEPLSLRDEAVRVGNGTLRYYVRVASVFGGYDVDVERAQARLYAGHRDVSDRLAPVDASSSRDHDGATRPVMFHYAIDVNGLDGASGPLRIDFAVPNRQGTFVFQHSKVLPFASFEASNELPSLPLMAVLVLLAALAAARRRMPG